MFGLYMRCYNDTCNGESIAHAFGHSVYISFYSGKIMTEKFSCSAVSTLHTIGYIYSAILIAKTADLSQKIFIGHIYTANPLYSFYDN